MSPPVSLFGGAVLIAALFLGLRRLGLASFWAAGLGGGAVLLAYLSYAAAVAPRLESLLAHLALYAATAAVLARPAVGRGPRAFRALLAAVALASLASLAWRMTPPREPPERLKPVLHPDTPNPGAPDPGATAGWRVGVNGLDDLRVGRPEDVRVRVRGGDDAPLSLLEVRLKLKRPAGSGPIVSWLLRETEAGVYADAVQAPGPGRWTAVIGVRARSGERGEWRQDLDIPAE